MQEIILRYSLDDINSILQQLGEVPGKYMLYPLIMNIKGQTEAQVGVLQTPEKAE